jgi:glycosyltransferase involved in cell wall biosynthesis
MKILYEMTYATRGQSGIPRDTKALAQILLSADGIQSDFVLNPRSYTKRRNLRAKDLKWISNELGDALRREPGRSPIPSVFLSALILLQSFSLIRLVTMLKLDAMQSKNVFNFLHLANKSQHASESNIFLLSISYLARFARPSYLKPFRIRTPRYNLFIQQQSDPIQVDKKTLHIVRLHDFLPISHPQYFDQNGVKVFSTSLRVMLKGSKKIWVMDSKATAEEFKTYFGDTLDVRVVPCVVKTTGIQDATLKVKKNQICIVNTIEPRKRVSLAIAGFRDAKERGLLPQDWQLVIVGNEGWQEKALVGNLHKQIFGADIIFKEGAPDFELEKVYAESKIVLSTSAAEGFGLPPLEGMAYGCLPVVSDIPQHHETVMDLGLYFKTDTPQEVAEKLGEALKVLSGKEVEISNRLINHVQKNYSEEVISKKWLDLLEGVKN